MVGMISPTELVEWFMQDCNQQFAAQLDQINMDDMDIPERITVAIQARLEYVIPVVRTWHQGMALGAVQNSITTAHQLEEIVTLISQKVGAPLSSSPLERTALGAVYVASELHLLTDTSHAYQDTWNFLKGRVDELHLLEQRRQQNPMSLDSVVAASAVVTSLAGGIVSLVQPTARGMAYSLLPQFMTMVMPTTSSATTAGSSPQDYSDLPPFPPDANSK
jgi:rpsU-divergently transcribed protein